jgi:cell division protein ZapA
MSFDEKGTKVRILDKEFRINCPKEKEQDLYEAASYLDKQMRQIRHSGKVIGLERVAIMAALNMSYEFLNLKNKRPEEDIGSLRDRLQALQYKIDDALSADDKPYDNIEINENALGQSDLVTQHEDPSFHPLEEEESAEY